MNLNKICVIGGSNSLLNIGYVNATVSLLERHLGKKPEVVNLSIGGTFSHFGLWQLITKNNWHDADLFLLEYALNDSELSSWGVVSSWAKAYEGIIKYIRAKNPKAQIINPLLQYQTAMLNPQLSQIYAGVAFINLRYKVHTVDVGQDIFSKAPQGYWNFENDWYSDPAHYNKHIQIAIANEVFNAIIEQQGISPTTKYLPVSSGNYVSAKSAVKENIFTKLIHRTIKTENFISSVANETAVILEEKDVVNFRIKGQLVALIIVSTIVDGVLEFKFGDKVAYGAIRRKAFDRKNFKFLINVVLPDQYFKKVVCHSEVLTNCSIRVLSDSEIEQKLADGIKIERRGTARNPDSGPHQLALIDILYTGDIEPNIEIQN